MALEMNDLMALKSMGGNELTPYEQYKIGFMQQKQHTGGVAISGLVLGTVGTAIGVGAWLFGGMYGYNLSKEPCYNSCSLWVTMNGIMSDSSETLAKYVESDKLFDAVYALAVDKLTDKDGKVSIRHKYGL